MQDASNQGGLPRTASAVRRHEANMLSKLSWQCCFSHASSIHCHDNHRLTQLP